MKTSRRNIASQPLSFTLFQRPIHPELFNIYRQFDFSSQRFSATIWVTAHCHVLTISAGSFHITELIATPGQPLPAGALLAKFQLPGQTKHTHVFGNSLKYHCGFSITKPAGPQHRKKMHKELKHLCGKNAKLINLPELSEGDDPAFTFIQFSSTDTQLSLQTRHSRPERNEMITTNTTMDMGKIA